MMSRMLPTIAVVMVSAAALPAQAMTGAQIRHAIELANAGDSRLADYVTSDVIARWGGEIRGRDALLSHLRALRRDRSIRFTPGLVVVDEKDGTIAVEMTVRQVARRDGVDFGANRLKARRGDALVSTAMLFITPAGGRIAALRITPSDRIVRTVNIAAAQAEGPTAAQLREPLPATVADTRMTRAKYNDYLRLFGRFDPRFTLFYDAQVVFDTAPAPTPLHGPEAIRDFYVPIRRNLDEHVKATTIVIDNAQGIIVVELHNRMTAARGDIQLPSRLLRIGEEREGSGVIVYSLKEGRISYIRGSAVSEKVESAQ